MRQKINVYGDLLNMMKKYEKQRREGEEIFLKYIYDEYIALLAKACLPFNEPKKTNPYNFNEGSSREKFVIDFLIYKINRGNFFLTLIDRETELELKTYLFECVADGVETLIRYNERNKKEPAKYLKHNFAFSSEVIEMKSYEDLLVLLKEYVKQKKEMGDIFYEYVTEEKRLVYFASACSDFNEQQKTNPYDFNQYHDREEFVRDFFADKTTRGDFFKKLINMETGIQFRTYLYKSISNAVITLIQYNQRKKRKPEGGFKKEDKKEFEEIPEIEEPDANAAAFQVNFPLLSKAAEIKSYRHLFWCSNLFNLAVRNYGKIETNSDERILNWRTE